MVGKFRLFMNNRLCCTFTTLNTYETIVDTIKS